MLKKRLIEFTGKDLIALVIVLYFAKGFEHASDRIFSPTLQKLNRKWETKARIQKREHAHTSAWREMLRAAPGGVITLPTGEAVIGLNNDEQVIYIKAPEGKNFLDMPNNEFQAFLVNARSEQL